MNIHFGSDSLFYTTSNTLIILYLNYQTAPNNLSACLASL